MAVLYITLSNVHFELKMAVYVHHPHVLLSRLLKIAIFCSLYSQMYNLSSKWLLLYIILSSVHVGGIIFNHYQIAKLARDLKKQLNIGFDSPSHMPPLASSGAADSSATSTATAAASTSTAATTTGLRTVTSAREGRLDSSGQC